MYSFQALYTQVQDLTNDDSAGTLTLIKSLINQTQHKLLTLRKDITEKSATDDTVASQQNYDLPYDYGKMFDLTVTVGSVAYRVTPLEDDVLWRDLNARSASYTSDIPQFYYVFNNQLYLYPTPASAGNTITFYYHKVVRDMTQADYTTGNVTDLANGAAAVTGGSTVWTAAMAGRFLRITSDGYWYEIASRTSNTAITLEKNFQGTTISSGTEVYTIGEMSIIPGGYNELLIWRPAALYYQQKGELDKASFYWKLYNDMERDFIADRSSKVESAIISGEITLVREEVGLRDPNSYPLSLTS